MGNVLIQLKIGISSRDIKIRYKNSLLECATILVDFESTINHCFQIEQIIKSEFSSHVIWKIEGFGWTETFKDIDIALLMDRINTLTSNEIYTTKIFKESFNLKYAKNFW